MNEEYLCLQATNALFQRWAKDVAPMTFNLNQNQDSNFVLQRWDVTAHCCDGGDDGREKLCPTTKKVVLDGVPKHPGGGASLNKETQ